LAPLGVIVLRAADRSRLIVKACPLVPGMIQHAQDCLEPASRLDDYDEQTTSTQILIWLLSSSLVQEGN